MFALGTVLSLLIGVSLGFFGGGGSILTVPLLVYVFGLETKVAIASSLLIVGMASISGALQHWRAGNLRPREGLVFGTAGMLGAYAGGRASAFLDGGLLLLLFAAMMLLTAGAMWRGRKDGMDPRSSELWSPGRLVLQGVVVGAFTGLIGAGGGFLIVPALALWAGLPMPAAVGTSLFVIVLKSGAAFLGYQAHAQADPTIVAVVTASALLGSLIGSRLATVVEPAALRRGFSVFVTAMGLFILVREGALLVSTVSPALPTSGPQLAFAIAMLGLGVYAGRASKRAAASHDELLFSQGAGI